MNSAPLPITDGCHRLRALGRQVLWQGGQDIVYDFADADADPARNVPP